MDNVGVWETIGLQIGSIRETIGSPITRLMGRKATVRASGGMIELLSRKLQFCLLLNRPEIVVPQWTVAVHRDTHQVDGVSATDAVRQLPLSETERPRIPCPDCVVLHVAIPVILHRCIKFEYPNLAHGRCVRWESPWVGAARDLRLARKVVPYRYAAGTSLHWGHEHERYYYHDYSCKPT